MASSRLSALANPHCDRNIGGVAWLCVRTQDKPMEAMIMNFRRMAVEMWPTLVFGGGLAVLVTSLSFENAGAVRVVDRLAPSLAANAGPVTLPAAKPNPVMSSADVADAAELLAQVAVAPKSTADK